MINGLRGLIAAADTGNGYEINSLWSCEGTKGGIEEFEPGLSWLPNRWAQTWAMLKYHDDRLGSTEDRA